MAYDYQTERQKLFTEDGTALLIKVRDKAIKLLGEAGAFTASKVFTSGDGWTNLAAIDYLVETGCIRRVTKPGETSGQDQVFTRP